MRSASITMLHQPTPRTDLAQWMADALTVIGMISARLVVVGAPFTPAADVLAGQGVRSVSCEELLNGSVTEPVATGEDDIALLQLTSGSTGAPRAVISRTATGRTQPQHGQGREARSRLGIMVNWLPLSHDMGMVGFLIGPMRSVRSGLRHTNRIPHSPLLWPALITKYGGTMTAAPNFAYSRAGPAPAPGPGRRLRSVQLRFVHQRRRTHRRHHHHPRSSQQRPFRTRETALVAAYGMAEATLAVSFTVPGGTISVDTVDHGGLREPRPTALAPARATTPQLRETRFPAPRYRTPRRRFEGVAHSRAASDRRTRHSRGRHRRRGTSPRRSRRRRSTTDGWLATGDLGYLTEAGEIVVCGRKKDMIIVGGRNIFPTDIEGWPDGRRGAPGSATAVRLAGKELGEEFGLAIESKAYSDPAEVARIRAELSTRVLAAFGVSPRFVMVTGPGTLPKTPSGKVRRAETVALIEAELARVRESDSVV